MSSTSSSAVAPGTPLSGAKVPLRRLRLSLGGGGSSATSGLPLESPSLLRIQSSIRNATSAAAAASSSTRAAAPRPQPDSDEVVAQPKRARLSTPKVTVSGSSKSTTAAAVTRTVEEAGVTLADLVKASYVVHAFAPLQVVKTDAASTAQYSKSLAGHAKSAVTDASTAAAEIVPSAALSKIGGLAGGSNIGVHVRLAMPSSNTRKRGVVVEGVALLLNVGSDGGADGSHPLLLMSGPAEVTAVLHAWLAETFEARILAVTPLPLELMWLAEQWCNLVPDMTSAKPLELQMSFPSLEPDLKHLTVSVEPTSLLSLRTALEDRTATVGNSGGLGAQMLQAVVGHVTHTTGINLTASILTRVTTNIASLGADGKLKIFDQIAASKLLAVLGTLCMLASQKLYS